MNIAFPRCGICNAELSYCGPLGVDGPTEDCLVCKLRAELDAAKARFTAPIVCMCGSTRFKQAWIAENARLTGDGNIVLAVGLWGHHERVFPDEKTKAQLDDLHKRKIDLCDWVWVLDVGGYVGESTQSEIDYATKLNKPVSFLSHHFPEYVEPADPLAAATERAEKAEYSARAFCGAHVGVPRQACPVCDLAAAQSRETALRKRVDDLDADLKAEWRANEALIMGVRSGNSTAVEKAMTRFFKKRAAIVEAENAMLRKAVQAVIATTGGSENWNGETHEFLVLCEAALAGTTAPAPAPCPECERLRDVVSSAIAEIMMSGQVLGALHDDLSAVLRPENTT